MPKTPKTRTVADWWPIKEDAPAADGTALFLRIPPDLADRVEVVRLAPLGRRRARADIAPSVAADALAI